MRTVVDNTVFTTRLTASNAIKLHLALISSSLVIAAARKVRRDRSRCYKFPFACPPSWACYRSQTHGYKSPCPLLLVISLVACRFLISVSFVFPRDEPASERDCHVSTFPGWQPLELFIFAVIITYLSANLLQNNETRKCTDRTTSRRCE